MITGCFTAVVTPFKEDTVDYEGLGRLSDFQIKNGITGILAVGTTGESPVTVAVLAHEIGHLVHRHGLRHALQSSTVALVIVAMTNDVASLSAFAAATPKTRLKSIR